MTTIKSLKAELQEFRAKTKQTLEVKPKSDENQTNGNVGLFSTLRQRMFSKNTNVGYAKLPTNEDSSNLQIQPDDVQVRYCSSDDESIHGPEPIKPWSRVDYAIVGTLALVYIIGQTITVMVGFGAVFFCISLLVFICLNLSDRRRRKGELSAYSVFNPGCQQLEGTVTAEKLQSNLVFGGI